MNLLARGLLKAEQAGLAEWVHAQRLIDRGQFRDRPEVLLKARPVAGQLGLFAEIPEVKKPELKPRRGGLVAIQKPPGAGWEPIPKGKHGGFRRRKGDGFDYWYPEKGVVQTLAPEDVEEAPVPPLEPVQPSAPADDAITASMAEARTKGERKKDNEEAVKIVQRALSEGRGLTDEEAVRVAGYTGKGGISGDLNQFYTRTDLAKAMWELLTTYQDAVGKVLEPSCGSGVLLQTAPKGVKVTGVELDDSAATIAEVLHSPRGHSVESKSFELFTIERMGRGPEFDAVIGNPPYCVRTGDIPRHKPEFRSADQYFIDTSLDHVKDGGVVVLLVHGGIMNNGSQGSRDFRERLLARAEVVDAFRCPNDIFKHVHCEIGADIIVLRKRDSRVGEALVKARGTDTLKPALMSLGAWDQTFIDGEWFERHPDRVLGKALSADETGWRATVVGDADKVPGEIKRLTVARIAAREKGPIAKPITFEALTQLAEQHDGLRENIAAGLASLQKAALPPVIGNVQTIAGLRFIYIGEPPKWTLAETVSDVSQIVQRSGDEAVKQAHEIAQDIADLIKARDAGEYYKARSMRRSTEDRVKAWVKENGIPGSHRALGELAKSAPVLLDFIACVDANGELSDVLSKDAAVTLKPADVDKSDLLSVAGYVARRNRGYVTTEDVQHNWEGWDGHSEEQIRDLLYASGQYATDGASGGALQHVEDYLTGDLYAKLDAEQARFAGMEEGREKSQIERQIGQIKARLKTKWRSIDDIPIQLRVMGWFPLDYFNFWLNSPEGRQTVFGRHRPPNPGEPTPHLTYAQGVYTLEYVNEGGHVVRRTSDESDWLKYMNRLSLRKEKAVDVEEHVQRTFEEWLKASEHRTAIEELYNRTFNAEFRREYSGDVLGLEGMSKGIVPHAFQNQAVRWAAETGRGLLGQDVGLGKTFIAILLARLRKQQGVARRPFVVVPKAVATNWAEEVETLFPGSRILVIGEHRVRTKAATQKATLAGEARGLTGVELESYVEQRAWEARSDDDMERNRKLAMVKQNEYDLIICTKPAFERIPLRHETIQRYETDDFWYQRAGRIDQIVAGSAQQQTADKRIEKLKASWANDKLQQKFKHTESMVFWEDLGVDCLIADEAHCFPAGTLIDGKAIETFKAGDLVKAFNHATGEVVMGRVANLQVRIPRDLFRVTADDGTSIVCTGKHPFFTPDGYVFAKDLLVGDTLYKNVNEAGGDEEKRESLEEGRPAIGDGNVELRVVRGKHEIDQSAGLEQAEGEAPVLLQQVSCDALETSAAGDQREDRGRFGARDIGGADCFSEGEGDKGRLAEYARSPSQGQGVIDRGWVEAPNSRGQWKACTRPTVEAISFPRCGVGDGACCGDGDVSRGRASETLQDRHCQPEIEDSNRSGRRIAPISYPQGPGPEERGSLAPVRVAGIEVYEPTSDGTFGGLCPGGVVYNIEIEEFHNYFVDDILTHNSYKNLYAARSRFGKNPKFLGGQGQSKQARKMQHMTRWVRDANPRNGVYFLTATPTKNSPLEVFNMLQHIAPEAFHGIGIENSEQFIDRFCQLEDRLILTPPGHKSKPGEDDDADDAQFHDEFEGAGNLESAQCVVGFTNLKELEGIMDKYMMLQTATDVGLKIPDALDHSHLVDMTPEQKEIYGRIRSAAMETDKQDDPGGMFRMLDQMKKAAQDLGLYDPTAYSGWYRKSPKYQACVEEAFKGAQERGGQIIFCDHNAAHERLRTMLIERGMKPEEIGIINAAVAPDSESRQRIGDAFNRGEIKIVIGNTGTMGEGVNLQGKKHARGTTDIHHLDQPWDPGTMHQRNGRGVRQGNKADQVNIHTYLAKGSFDGFRHSTLKGKERWLDKLRSGADHIANEMEGQGIDDVEMLAMLSDNPDAALALIKDRRASAETAWYARQAQEAVDTFYSYQRKMARLAKLAEGDSRVRLTEETDRLKRQLLRNELLPLEIKAHLNAGDKRPVAVSTAMVGEGDAKRLGARLVRAGSVLIQGEAPAPGKTDYRTKYVVDTVNLQDRKVEIRQWGHGHGFSIEIDKIASGAYTLTEYTATDELKEALEGSEESSWSSPLEAVSHIQEDVLAENQHLIDEKMRLWYAKHGQSYKGEREVLVKTPEGVKPVPASGIGTSPIVFPWGEDRAALIDALVAGNRDDAWQLWSNPIFQAARGGQGTAYTKGPMGKVLEDAEARWKARHRQEVRA